MTQILRVNKSILRDYELSFVLHGILVWPPLTISCDPTTETCSYTFPTLRLFLFRHSIVCPLSLYPYLRSLPDTWCLYLNLTISTQSELFKNRIFIKICISIHQDFYWLVKWNYLRLKALQNLKRELVLRFWFFDTYGIFCTLLIY